MEDFIDHFFPYVLSKAKIDELMNLTQGTINMRESNLQFTQLSRYALDIVSDMRARMRKFLSGVSKYMQ